MPMQPPWAKGASQPLLQVTQDSSRCFSGWLVIQAVGKMG